MQQLTPEEIGEKFPELLAQLENGEEILVVLEGRVVAKFTGVAQDVPRSSLRFGFAKGKFFVSEDFDEPLEDFAPYS